MKPALLALACITLIQAPDDPPEWRDRRAKCPVEAWDALEGAAAPSLTQLGGWENTQPLDWEDLRGNVVLLHLWASWAGNKKELAHLVELHEKFADEGLVIASVHSKKNHSSSAKILTEEGVPYVVASDLEGALAEALSVKFWSAYYLIDRDGVLRYAGINKKADGDGKLYVDHVVEAALAQPWEGERKQVEYTPKDLLAEEEPATKIPTGWPSRPDKDLGGRDVRGQAGPTLEGLTWLTEEPRLEGKCVLLDLWATWCGPCVRSMPDLQDLHERFGSDLVVIGISDQAPGVINPRTGEPWGSVVADFLAGKDFTYAQAIDPTGRLKTELAVTGIPHVLLMDSKGTVRWQGVPGAGPDPLEPPLVAQVIAADRRQRGVDAPVSVDGTGPVDAGGWPRIVEKKLYARVDLRGKQAPELDLGQWLTPEVSRQDKVVLIDFWATWCAPCKKLMPTLESWATDFEDDLAIISISDEDLETVRSFLGDKKPAYGVSTDPSAKLKESLGVQGIPHVLVIDSQGVVRWQGYPSSKEDPLTREVLERIIELDRPQRGEDF